MISRRKSFAIALSREMVPTARLVVYYISGQPEEIVMDSISFYVSGLRANPVSMNICGILQPFRTCYVIVNFVVGSCQRLTNFILETF